MTACQYCAQHGNGLRFVIFNTNQHVARLQDVREDTDTFHYLCSTVLHQTVIGGDIWLALGGIDDQRLNFIAAAAQFGARREPCTTQTGNAELMNAFDKCFTTLGAVVAPAVTVYPAIFTVGFNNDAQFRQCRRVGNGMGRNRHHFAGRWGVYRQHTSATKGQRLAAKDNVTFFYAQFTFRADMLFQRHDVTGGQRNLTQRRTVGLGFHLWRMNTAVKVPNLLFSERRK